MNSIILMADVVHSHEKEGSSLMVHFREVVDWANKIYRESIRSPLTITLGDEFQGVVSSVSKGVDIILAMEEYIIEEELDFKLRYVLHQGDIDTPINEDKAYEMLGSGLTNARKMLNGMKKEQGRFKIAIGEDEKLTKMMRITQHFIDGWFPKDRSTVSGFLQGRDYKELAKIQGKDESSLWRRRKSLSIEEYVLCKELIHQLIDE